MIKKVKLDNFIHQDYPFSVPAINEGFELEFAKPVTILVGDNGSGKSTFLKSLAYYNESINVSSHDINSSYYQEVRDLSSCMKCTYDVKTKKGFFFSGEEFITFITEIKKIKEELKEELNRVNKEYKHKSKFAQIQARSAARGQLSAMNNSYNGELNQMSHGEGFLEFFKERMHQKGVYILDEPETPLSAINQYQLLVLITDLVKNGSQVIIATHSPILMAIKDAEIYSFGKTIEKINYEDIENVSFTKAFLNNPDVFLDRL